MSGAAERRPHRGEVVGPDGAPLADALVAVLRGTAPTPEIAIRTDAAGRFTVALPPGRFVIQADGPAGQRGSVEVEVGDSGSPAIRITAARKP